MNESLWNRSSWLIRNKQKHFLNLWPQAYFRWLTQWETGPENAILHRWYQHSSQWGNLSGQQVCFARCSCARKHARVFLFLILPSLPNHPLHVRKKKKKENKAVRHPRGSAERQLSKVFLIRICSEAEEEERERRGGSSVRTGSLSLDCSLPDTLIC